MLFFSSEYECKLDAKGRLVLPAKIKSNLPQGSENELYIIRGFEPCLVIYPKIEYQKLFSKINGLNDFNPNFRRFQRTFFRGNAQVELDNMGRFLIPKTMIKYAQLEKDIIIVGMGNRAEIWNPELYNQNLIDDPEEFASMAQEFFDG